MLIFIFSLISSAHACTYQLNQTEVHMGDRSIYFGDYLHQKVQAKGYNEVESGKAPDYAVDLNLKTYAGDHFQHVQSTVSLINMSDASVFSKSADTRCYMQLCGAKDGAKVIRKSIDDFGKNLPVCHP